MPNYQLPITNYLSRIPPRPSLLATILAAATLTATALPARADWHLTTADLSHQSGFTINTWTPDAGLSITAAGGKLQTLPTRDVVLLADDRQASPATGPDIWRLRLRNGDLIFGQPQSMSGQSITIKTTDLGNVSLPLKAAVELLRWDGQPHRAPGPGHDQDVVYLGNGDTRKGIVVGLTPEKLQIAMGADNIQSSLDFSGIDSVAFGGVAAPRGVPPLSLRITTTAGTALTIPLDKPGNFSWSIPAISFADPAGPDPHKIVPDRIVSLEVLGGRLVYLSDIDPAKDEQSTFMGTSYPTRPNANVTGGPLRVAGTTYDRGLGVHTHSVLTYNLDGNFDTLTFRPAVDDSAGPQGEANLAVAIDGKIAWHADNLKGLGPHAAAPEQVSLPIKGAHTIELRADSPGRMDVLGRVDWLDAALLRP
ncbi:MAG TPA: NPCBM/NEW2 domain-containing protein [Phycisphaerae bacterium]|nr:NPCBM/NEW2 domain-containing protein [Phycisphaerae bacterium]